MRGWRRLGFNVQQPETQSAAFFAITLLTCVVIQWKLSVSLTSTLIVFGVGLLFSKGIAAGRRFPRDVHPRNLSGKRVLITGGSEGLGWQVATRLVQWGAQVIILCDNSHQVPKELSNQISYVQVDLSSTEQIKQFVADWKKNSSSIDILIHNASTFCSNGQCNSEGTPLSFAVNYVGPFLLTKLLLSSVAPQGRIIQVSCSSHFNVETVNQWPFCDTKENPHRIYDVSKLALVCSTRSLQRHLQEVRPKDELATFAVHPGIVNSDTRRMRCQLPSVLYRFVARVFNKSPYQGAQTILFCAAAPLHELEPGGFYWDCQPGSPSTLAQDNQTATQLWEETEDFLAGLHAKAN